ncbi:MAG: hypothetical protein U0575_11085 [Phycisphaerales bacterium]
MTHVSSHGGSSASTAKYQSRYQSGAGLTFTSAGSGGRSSAGGPKIAAHATMASTIVVMKTTSRHAACGKKGTPPLRSRAS